MMQTSPIYNFYSYEGNAMDNIIYWGTFIFILLAGLGVFGTPKPANYVLWMNLQDDCLSSGR